MLYIYSLISILIVSIVYDVMYIYFPISMLIVSDIQMADENLIEVEAPVPPPPPPTVPGTYQ